MGGRHGQLKKNTQSTESIFTDGKSYETVKQGVYSGLSERLSSELGSNDEKEPANANLREEKVQASV